MLTEPFAQAHGLEPGDHLRAVINGRWRELSVVGIALSPEYVYAIGPGALMPDDQRFGVLWMGHEALQAAFDLDGAFNDVSLALLRGTDPEAVVDRVDRLLARYGGIGAYARADQLSNWFLMNEIDQHRTLATILPTIFLAVAAFLTHMVLGRLIAVERSEIGLLKAFGYSNRDIAAALHALRARHRLRRRRCSAGSSATGSACTTRASMPSSITFRSCCSGRARRRSLIAGAVSLGAALIGALARRSRGRGAAAGRGDAAAGPAAVPAHRAEPLGFVQRLDQPTRILLRQVVRWPVRSFITTAGIAMSVAVLVTSMQWLDAIDHMVNVYFLRGPGART